MKRVQSGEGVTDVQAALGGPDHVVPDVVVEVEPTTTSVEPPFNKDIREQYSVGEVIVEPTRRLEDAASEGERPSEVRLIGDSAEPVSARLDEVEEPAVSAWDRGLPFKPTPDSVVRSSSDLVDARGYVERALTEDGVLTLPELHLCNALVRVIDYLVALQEEA